MTSGGIFYTHTVYYRAYIHHIISYSCRKTSWQNATSNIVVVSPFSQVVWLFRFRGKDGV